MRKQWSPFAAITKDRFSHTCRTSFPMWNWLFLENPNGRIAVEVQSDLSNWMTAFVEHHQSERELVSMAASYDVGGNG